MLNINIFGPFATRLAVNVPPYIAHSTNLLPEVAQANYDVHRQQQTMESSDTKIGLPLSLTNRP